MEPAVALLTFMGLLTATTLLVWPGWGLLARFKRGRQSTERVLLEDAVKHVYASRAVGRGCTVEELADHLGVTESRAEGLLDRLVESDLVNLGADGAALTSEGRESALRLIRAHRLWERYLADRTNLPAGEWHDEAERMEHTLTPDEVDRLSSRLGHPRWDPHGDAIPTADGELPPTEQAPVEQPALSDVGPGATVEVVHLEDEPREIYEALLSDGIELGARLEVVEADDEHVRVQVGGSEWALARPAARNVTVRLLPAGTRADGPVATLHDLQPGQAGRVVGISPACLGSQRRRLLDLGVVRGTEIEAELRSAAGDPIAYRIRGALIALRSQQAEWIRIESAETAAGAES